MEELGGKIITGTCHEPITLERIFRYAETLGEMQNQTQSLQVEKIILSRSGAPAKNNFSYDG